MKLLLFRNLLFFSPTILLFFLTIDSVEARVIVVPADVRTIQEAVDSAEKGDHIIVEAGHYRENILLDKALFLTSRHGYEKTVIEAKETDKAVIKVTGVSGGKISGFMVTGSSRAGIHIDGASAVEVSGNVIEKNGRGLFLENTVKSLVLNNIARENQDGIYLTASEENRIEKNIARLNANKGIVLYRSHRNVLTGNKASSNEWNGITLVFSNNNLVANNRATRNTYAIVVSGSEGNELKDNVTRGRIHYVLPVLLIYFSMLLYMVERKLFIYYLKKRKAAPVENKV